MGPAPTKSQVEKSFQFGTEMASWSILAKRMMNHIDVSFLYLVTSSKSMSISHLFFVANRLIMCWKASNKMIIRLLAKSDNGG